jgi:uncharacterized oxidoreductase
MVIDPEAFRQRGEFLREVEALIGHVKTSRLAEGCSEILAPGEPEARERQKRARDGFPVEEETWSQIAAVAARYRVNLEAAA